MLTKEQQEALERLKADLAAALDIPVAYVNVYAGDLRTLLSLTEAQEAESLTAAEKLSVGLKEAYAHAKGDDSLTTVHQRLVAPEAETSGSGYGAVKEAVRRAGERLEPFRDVLRGPAPEAEAVEPVCQKCDGTRLVPGVGEPGYPLETCEECRRTSGTLQADLDRAVEALEAASDQFRYYAESHAAKGTPDGDAKAKANLEWAERLTLAAITKGQKP